MAPSSYYVVTTFLYLTTVFHSAYSLEEEELPPCKLKTFSGDKAYAICKDLRALNSSIHWTYDGVQSTLSIAFVAPPPRLDGWVSWALNPTGSGMVGSQALVAFRDAGGEMIVKTYNISSYGPLMESKVWYEVKALSAEFSDRVVSLFATLVLPEKGLTTIDHVWQVGGSIMGGVLDKHDFQLENLKSKGRLHLMRGDRNDDDPPSFKRNVHAVTNVIGWGIWVPIEILISRYLKRFQSDEEFACLEFHLICHVLILSFGMIGVDTGFKLIDDTEEITYSCSGGIGIALIVLVIIQLLAFVLQEMNKPENFWDICYHGCQYTVLVLGVINILKGFDILKPESKWKIAYIVMIIVMGGIAVFMEAISCYIIKTKRVEEDND